jgi:hypothetical protein
MVEGIFMSYVTGAAGYSAILFALRNGRLAGADVGGVKYTGTYFEEGNLLKGRLTAVFPPNTRSITGHENLDAPTEHIIPFEIHMESIGTGHFSLSTPIGPITGSLQRVHDLP